MACSSECALCRVSKVRVPANMAPLGDTTHVIGFRLAGDPADAVVARALGYIATPGYAESLKLRLEQGRLLSHSDVGRPIMAMIVNEEFVRSYLNDGQPVIGRIFTGILGPKSRVEVVGVIGNVLKNGLTDDPRSEIYVALGTMAATTGSEINLAYPTPAKRPASPRRCGRSCGGRCGGALSATHPDAGNRLVRFGWSIAFHHDHRVRLCRSGSRTRRRLGYGGLDCTPSHGAHASLVFARPSGPLGRRSWRSFFVKGWLRR